MIIGGIERSAKWVDENWMKIASDPTPEILEFIQKKCTECLNSEFLPTEVERICRQWLSYCNTQKKIDDELL